MTHKIEQTFEMELILIFGYAIIEEIIRGREELYE